MGAIIKSWVSSWCSWVMFLGILPPGGNSGREYWDLLFPFYCHSIATHSNSQPILADLLQTHPYVHLIALDFSKAFDTVRHSTLLDKCRQFPILNSLYNWLARYLEDRQHITKFGGMLSELGRITASIVQGSGIGPTAFVLTASDLRAMSLLIFLNKYADDVMFLGILPPGGNSGREYWDLLFPFYCHSIATHSNSQPILADLLQTHPYVHLIALDFSKAFDTVRHSTLLDKCRQFPILNSLYNWLARYLEDRQHITKFGGMLSELGRITASIVQGSGIGPTAFVLTASDLRAMSLLIFLNKYADDCYLIVPPDQASLISTELAHVEKWAQDNNLKLNVLKTKEMIVRCHRTRLGNIPSPTPGIERVTTMKILGVVYEENFTFREHVDGYSK